MYMMLQPIYMNIISLYFVEAKYRMNPLTKSVKRN